jgi:hypothetical protein
VGNLVGKKIDGGFGFFLHATDAKTVMPLLMALGHGLHAGWAGDNISTIRASATFEWCLLKSTRVVLK